MADLKRFVSRFKDKNILVIGDVILDQYLVGDVSRISPEAPVPVVAQREASFTPGGAANVAHNLTSLGAKVTLVGRVGADTAGEVLIAELKKRKINTSRIVVEKAIPTITKTRVMAQHHQMLRIDNEVVEDWKNNAAQKDFRAYFQRNLKRFDAVILSDYGKGLLTAALVEFICSCASEKQAILTIDPKVGHFPLYRNVTAITPNLKEAENAIKNIKITSTSGDKTLGVHSETLKTDKEIDLAGRELLKFLELDSLLITLGERGMRLFEKGKAPVSISTKAQEVYDVTGAGDAVISVFTLALTAGASKVEAANLANIAAGIVVGHLGAVAVKKSELLAAVS